MNDAVATPGKLAQLKAFIRTWRGHLQYLQQLFREDRNTAWPFWRATYLQRDELEIAINSLHERSLSDSFEWLEIPRVLSNFVLRPDDQGQADWYAEAHRQYHALLKKLELEGARFKPAMLDPLINELRYISTADAFHQKYRLTELQTRMKAMYEALLQRIDEFNAMHKSEIQAKQAEAELEKIRAQETLVNAENEKLAQQNRLVQEQRLKVVEEKKRLEAKRAADEAEQQRIDKQREYDAEAAQRRRQEELQASFRDLSWQSGGAPTPASAPAPAPEPVLATVDQKVDALMQQLRTQDSLSDAEIEAAGKLYEMLKAKFG